MSPAISPAIINPPIAINTVDGECMPNSLQNASMILLPKFFIASIADENPDFIPFAIPSTISWPAVLESFRFPIHLKNFENASRIFSNTFCKSSKVGSDFLT